MIVKRNENKKIQSLAVDSAYAEVNSKTLPLQRKHILRKTATGTL